MQFEFESRIQKEIHIIAISGIFNYEENVCQKKTLNDGLKLTENLFEMSPVEICA